MKSRKILHSSVTVYLPDTDILVMLIYHLKNTWNGVHLYLLKVAASRTMLHKRELQLFPISNVLEHFKGYVIDQLPAAHSLTGCDTIAKVGTKNAMMKVLIEEDRLLTHFGKEQPDYEMISDAEQFIVKVVASKKIKQCSAFDEL